VVVSTVIQFRAHPGTSNQNLVLAAGGTKFAS
jgi:hypothetical protein